MALRIPNSFTESTTDKPTGSIEEKGSVKMTRPKKLDAAVLGSILGLAFTVALTMVFVGQLIMILDIDVRHGHNRTQIVADIILFSAPVLLGLTGITVMICFLMKSIRECRQDSS